MSLSRSRGAVAAFVTSTTRSLQRLAAAAALGLVALGVAAPADAGLTFTGQFGTGDTWNVYEAINTQFSFKQALEFAAARPDPTGGSAVGHLVTLSSLAENNFVNSMAPGDRWIGLSDRVGVAPGAMESQFQFDPLTQGWAWITGEPFTFQNWNAGEPNNAGAGEDAVHLIGSGLWNDNASGFGADDPVPDPDPVFGNSTAEPATAFGFVIEWSLNAATEPTGFPMTRPDPPLPRIFPAPLTRLEGPDGTASAWGSRDKLFTSGSGGTRTAVDRYLSADGTPVDGTLALFAFRDPETNGTTPVAGAAAVPFVSNTAADDNNFVTVVKGTFEVPAGQGGVYTFSVRSDDGFAMRVLSQPTGGSVVQHPFTSARTGLVDEDGTLVFMPPTGDSNTQGTINLAPGTYDVEYLMFEDGGGAYGEVSTAKGDFVTGGGFPQYILLGSNESRAEQGPFNQAARLTAPANVFNYSGAPGTIATSVTNFRTNPGGASSQGTVDTVAIVDGDDICCGRPAAGLPAPDSGTPGHREFFPNVGVLVPHDNYTTAVTGSFQVLDTNGAAGETLTFGIFSDDYTGLHIIGQSFTGVADFTGDGTATLGNPEGGADQWVLADYFTGNTNAFGLITLAEGTYNFEAFQGEGGGDSGLEIWVAAGDHLATGFNGAAFFPLTTATLDPRTLPANQGLPRVAGPGTGPDEAMPIAGDFDGNGSVGNSDLTLLLNNWGEPVPPVPAGWTGAQPTPDAIGNDELTALLNTWGDTAGLGAGAVPEPTSAVLALVAFFGGALVCVRRRGL